jgi:hypothetical protein
MRPLLIFLALLLPATADAHEYWLLPDRFAAPVGETVAIEHRVGTGWPGQTLPRDPARIVRFAVVDARGPRPIAGDAGDDPAGTFVLRAPGLAVAFYRSTPTPITLEPALFETYLRDEGLDAVAAARAAAGDTARPAREIFSRNAKAMLTARSATSAGSGPPALSTDDAQRWRRPVGLALEIVPDSDPRRLAAGAPFALRVLHRGRPLEGALVKAFAQGSATAATQQRTDAQGRAALTLPSAGVWLVNVVHMTAAPAGSGADWASLWSSLTLDLPAAPASGVRTEPVADTPSPDGRVERWVDLAEPAGDADRGRPQRRRAEQDRVAAAVRDLGGEVTTRIEHARNALLVRIAPDRIAELRLVPGVVRVRPVGTLHPPGPLSKPTP